MPFLFFKGDCIPCFYALSEVETSFCYVAETFFLSLTKVSLWRFSFLVLNMYKSIALNVSS